MAPASKGKSQADHLATFNSLAAAYRARPTDKLLQEMEKVVAVLAKVSDMALFHPGRKEGLQLLLHCSHLLATVEGSKGLVWGVVGLLATLAQASTDLATFLVTRLNLLPTLTRVAQSSPSTPRHCRLVELVHLLAAASTVTRKEAHLAILLEHLAALVADPASPLATPALHALASLTRRSYVGAKAALAFLPIDKLTLVAFTRPVDQVSAEYLCFNLRRVHLSSTPPSEDRLRATVRKLADVFAASLAAEDALPALRLLLAFLADLGELAEYRAALAATDVTHHVLQLLAAKEFADGFQPAAADALFVFVARLVRLGRTEVVSLYEQVVRVVMARLEAKPSSGARQEHAASALQLVTAVLGETDVQALSEPEQAIIRFQVEQLLPALQLLVLEVRPGKEGLVGEVLPSLLACLHLLQEVARVEEWRGLVATQLQPTKLASAYRAVMGALGEESERARLATEFLTLAHLLRGEGKWRKVVEEVEGEPATLAMVASVLRRAGEQETMVRKALAILKATDYTMVEEVKEQEVEGREEEVGMSAEQVLRIDQMLERVTECLATSTLDPVVAEVVEVALERRGAERLEVEALQVALEGADLQVRGLSRRLAVKEQRQGALERQVAALVARAAGAREELGEIRGQHGALTVEADTTRERLGKQLEDRQAELQEVSEEKEKLEATVAKYKEKMEELKQSLKTYQENEEALTSELKKEMKLKDEKEMKLKKSDDKLRKKERQLEDELGAREKAEKEAEDLRKKCLQLQTLSKSQETALTRKEKQIQEQDTELKELRQLQATIFNLSKTRNSSSAC